jgi:maleate isomerase
MTTRGQQHLETCGLTVVSSGHLTDVRNIYEENSERAYAIARQVDHPGADAIFLSGVGMPTLDALKAIEEDTGKPVISAASAMMWHALRTAGVQCSIRGYGQLLESGKT